MILQYDLVRKYVRQWLRIPNTIITAITANVMGHHIYASTYSAAYQIDLLTATAMIVSGRESTADDFELDGALDYRVGKI